MIRRKSRSDEEAVHDRIRRGLTYTESEPSFQAPRRRSDLIFDLDTYLRLA
jgi:hypothetical protein